MKRLGLFTGLVAAIAVAYALSFGISLRALENAVRAGNGDQVLALTDVGRVRRSITAQIVAAYNGGGQVKPLQQMIARTYGASVADAMLGKLLTAENLTSLLRTGAVAGDAADPKWSIPPLTRITSGNLLSTVKRLLPTSLLEVELRLSDAESGDDFSAANFRFEGNGWQLSGLTLAKSVIRDIVQTIPAK